MGRRAVKKIDFAAWDRDGSPFKWWRDAVAGLNPPAHPSEPQCGFFQRRLVRNGVFVAACILPIDATPGDHLCIVNGQAADALDQWVWLCGHPITFDEFQHLNRRHAWAIKHAADHAFANPKRPVDLRTVPLPKIKRK
jgi:hypothetical protein